MKLPSILLAAALAFVLVPQVKSEQPPPDAPYGYLMVHFMLDRKGYGEKVFLSISQGDDPERWDPLNSGQPVLVPNESTTGVRDPYLAWNPETKTYYIISTDLKAYGGDMAGWDVWRGMKGAAYSTKLHVWESTDLIHWQAGPPLDVAANRQGLVQKSFLDPATGKRLTRLGMAWAPEATWVPDFYDLDDDGKDNGSARGGAFVVYWSSKTEVDGGPYQTVVLWGSTPEFSQKTYAVGGLFVHRGTANTIDVNLLQKSIGNGRLRTYRFTKEGGTGNGIVLDVTDSPTWWKAKDWQIAQSKIGNEWSGNNPEGVEAPASFASHNGKWYLFVDKIGGGGALGYRPMVSTDLDAKVPWEILRSPDFHLRDGVKHGSVLPLTRRQYDAIRAADAKPADNPNLTVEAAVAPGLQPAQVAQALPATVKVKTAGEPGEAGLPITWDVADLAKVSAAKPGAVVEVLGTVDTLGANFNHWRWTDAAGAVRLDDDPKFFLAKPNAFQLTGGFNPKEGARPLFASTAIKVIATVTVQAR